LNTQWVYYLGPIFGFFFSGFYYEYFLLEGERKYYHRKNLKLNEDSVLTLDRPEDKVDFNYLNQMNTIETMNDEDNINIASTLTY
jgi:hypothetical protein